MLQEIRKHLDALLGQLLHQHVAFPPPHPRFGPCKKLATLLEYTELTVYQIPKGHAQGVLDSSQHVEPAVVQTDHPVPPQLEMEKAFVR
jgi:hypothetical protein